MEQELEFGTYSCKFCNQNEPACVAMCNNCKKWFCNGGEACDSHIVNHLERLKHTEVRLHEDGPLGDTVLECYECGKRNVFVLGFVPSKTNFSIILLCRRPCAMLNSAVDADWNREAWKPIIKDHCFLHWLLKVSPVLEQPLKETQSDYNSRLEEFWRDSPRPGTTVLGKIQPQRVLLRYTDSVRYYSIFAPLVKLELIAHKKSKEWQIQDNTEIRWDITSNGKATAYFHLTTNEKSIQLQFGDVLQLRHSNAGKSTWIAYGSVVRVPDNCKKEVALELKINKKIPASESNRFAVNLVWNSDSFHRMLQALRKFVIDDSVISKYLQHKILGHDVQEITFKSSDLENFAVPNLPPLNNAQIQAIRVALKTPLTIITGYPGTGKTITLAAIAYYLVKQNVKPVLVCAPSNEGVDILAAIIHRMNLKVIRVYKTSTESENSFVSFLDLQNQVRTMSTNIELKKLQQLRNEQGKLSGLEENRYHVVYKQASQELLQNADIVCSTCVGAGDPRLLRIKFTTVLIDNATRATEPECVIPITLGAKQLVLAGDHFQLAPAIMCKKASKAGLGGSLYERLIVIGNTPVTLEEQYRMHPELLRFANKLIYDDAIQNGLCAGQRELARFDFPWPAPSVPMFFYISKGSEEMLDSRTSYINQTEATVVENLTTRFLKCGVRPQQIGIITFYESQKMYLSQCLVHQGAFHAQIYRQVEINTVEAFQGLEKDIIIVSCVRSNDKKEIGGLEDPRKLVVAVTRAKYVLVIVGNPEVLVKVTWKRLIIFCKEQRILVDGPLDNLRENGIPLIIPQVGLPARNTAVGCLIPSCENKKPLNFKMGPDIMYFLTSKNKTILATFVTFCGILGRNKQNVNEFFDTNIHVTLEEAISIYRRTYGQNNDEWRAQRQVRITGSTCYSLYIFNQPTPDKWNAKIKEIVMPSMKEISYIQFGKHKEKIALSIFQESHKDRGKVESKCGFIINPNAPWAGFSPGGFFKTNDNKIILLEVKCPKIGREISLEELYDKLEFIIKKSGRYYIKQRHRFYAQIQLGLLICNLKLAYLIIYCEKSNANIEIEVYFDEIFLRDMLNGLCHVYIKRFLPFLMENSDKLLLCGK